MHQQQTKKLDYTGTQRYGEMRSNAGIQEREQKTPIRRFNHFEGNGEKFNLSWKTSITKNLKG